MTTISFFKKVEGLIDNYDYNINLAQTDEEKFKESLKVNKDDTLYSEKEIKVFPYSLIIKYVKQFGIQETYKKIETLYYLLPDNNYNNILLKTVIYRLLYMMEKLYMSFILQKLFSLINKAAYPWNEDDLRQVTIFLQKESGIDYLLGIEGDRITNQLSFFADIKTDDEKELGQDDTIMQSRMVNAYLVMIDYINALGIDEYRRRRDYIINLIRDKKIEIDVLYQKKLFSAFYNINKEMREYNQRLKRIIKKDHKQLIILP